MVKRAPPALSAYEQQRLENIKRNQAELAALGIEEDKENLKSATNKNKPTQAPRVKTPSLVLCCQTGVEKRAKFKT